MKKTFHIGEYAVGGTIKAEVRGTNVFLSVYDYKTSNNLIRHKWALGTPEWRAIQNCIEWYTTPYYADKIVEYLQKSYVKINL